MKTLFYKTNHRRKTKILTLGARVKHGPDVFVFPKLISQKLPIKSMFMAGIDRLVHHRIFEDESLQNNNIFYNNYDFGEAIVDRLKFGYHVLIFQLQI